MTNKWSSSLGNIETRLRRSLGLSGPIGLTLPEPLPLQPIVLTDDATRPGSCTFRGRRFNWIGHVEGITNMTGYGFGLRCVAQNGMIARWVNVHPGGDYHCRIDQYAPLASLPTYMAAATAGTNWVEAPLSSTDFAPAQTGSGAEQSTSASIAQYLGFLSGDPWHVPLDYYIPNGGTLVVTDESANLVDWSLSFTMALEVF
jgi:hypothetical protein